MAEKSRLPPLNDLIFLGAENGTLLWTPNSLEPFTLEILARNVKDNLSSLLQPKTVVCACKGEEQCLYNQTRWVGNSSLEVSAGRRVRRSFPFWRGKEVEFEGISKPLCGNVCWEVGGTEVGE